MVGRRAKTHRRSEAFLEQAMPHLDMLHSLARHHSVTREDAEDLVQESMLQAFRSWQSGTVPASMGAWLGTICLNLARSRVRRAQARPRETQDDAMLILLPGDVDVAVTALAGLEAKQVRAALTLLPDAQREAIVLVDLCGMSTAEVARALGIPRGTVLSRLHRGHRALAELVRESVAP